jgi:hypothetical protein
MYINEAGKDRQVPSIHYFRAGVRLFGWPNGRYPSIGDDKGASDHLVRQDQPRVLNPTCFFSGPIHVMKVLMKCPQRIAPRA